MINRTHKCLKIYMYCDENGLMKILYIFENYKPISQMIKKRILLIMHSCILSSNVKVLTR